MYINNQTNQDTMAPWWTHHGSSSTLDVTRYCFVAPSSWFDSLPSGFSLAPMGIAVLRDGAVAARSNASVGASFAANSAFSNDLLASTRSRYGWTATLSTPFSSCHGKRLNLKKEEVCARKNYLNRGISSLVICGHINGSSHITEQVHLWQHDDYLAVDEALWQLCFPLRHGKAEACWWHLWHLHNRRYEIRFLARKPNLISSEFWGISEQAKRATIFFGPMERSWSGACADGWWSAYSYWATGWSIFVASQQILVSHSNSSQRRKTMTFLSFLAVASYPDLRGSESIVLQYFWYLYIYVCFCNLFRAFLNRQLVPHHDAKKHGLHNTPFIIPLLGLSWGHFLDDPHALTCTLLCYIGLHIYCCRVPNKACKEDIVL